MNENNKQPFKMSVSSMNCIAIITVVGKLIFQRVGTSFTDTDCTDF